VSPGLSLGSSSFVPHPTTGASSLQHHHQPTSLGPGSQYGSTIGQGGPTPSQGGGGPLSMPHVSGQSGPVLSPTSGGGVMPSGAGPVLPPRPGTNHMSGMFYHQSNNGSPS
jgi:hypothetical protein